MLINGFILALGIFLKKIKKENIDMISKITIV